MSLQIQTLDSSDIRRWNDYVLAHPHGTHYHLSDWREVIRRSYGHRSYYLVALDNECAGAPADATGGRFTTHKVVGVLPLTHLHHILFGNSLVSVAFLDLGGVLADHEQAERALLTEAVKIARETRATSMELRQTRPLSVIEAAHDGGQGLLHEPYAGDWTIRTRSHKVRMLLALPDSPELLLKSFTSKLRSQIRRPVKAGLTAKVGSVELLDDFYKVFCANMRDLGSPVHSKRLMANVLRQFPSTSALIVVYKDKEPLAASLVVGCGTTLENPWASSLREYGRMSPNMLLYWTMLEYACSRRYRCFDFGRSTPGEGTFKFKEQWGAKPETLHWHYILSDKVRDVGDGPEQHDRRAKAVQYWQRLPVWATRILGPLIRKHIGL